MKIIGTVRDLAIVEVLRKLLPDKIVNLGYHLPLAILANFLSGFPARKLTIIGVTGTDGKTTTATMIYHLLHQAGFKVALISTVAAYIGDQEMDTGFHVTSPSPFPLQRLLKQIVTRQFSHVVLEVTSHGLAQHRFWGVPFEGGVLTNISEDHLDYHGSMEAYARAKAQLFEETKFAVLNREEAYFEFFQQRAHGKIITYGAEKGDWNLKSFVFKLPMRGEYNRLNALAAAAVATELGVKLTTISSALQTFPGVKGRMQILYDNAFVVMVDFAHTPHALHSVLAEWSANTKLATSNSQSTGRIITVFGCAGSRDKNRRKMGQVSAQLADITIITAEDPRTEGVEPISEEIAEWARKGGAKESSMIKVQSSKFKQPVFLKIPDRQEAIDFAIGIARPGDRIGIFGKGHERSMCFGTVETPWTDQEAVKRALKKRSLI